MTARLGLALAAIAIALAPWALAATPAGAQEPARKYSINIAAMILAEPGIETSLPIQIAPGDSIPKNSFIRLRGLPPSVMLSEGHLISPGSWAVPLAALPALKLTAPISAVSKSQLNVALVGVDGTVWAETKASLAVIPASSLPGGDQAASSGPPTTIATVGPSGTPPPQAGTSVPMVQPALPRAGEGAVPLPQAPRTQENERAVKLVIKGNEQLQEGDVAGIRRELDRLPKN